MSALASVMAKLGVGQRLAAGGDGEVGEAARAPHIAGRPCIASGSKSLTSQATLTGIIADVEAGDRARARDPGAEVAPVLLGGRVPMGVIAPSPVTTTRRASVYMAGPFFIRALVLRAATTQALWPPRPMALLIATSTGHLAHAASGVVVQIALGVGRAVVDRRRDRARPGSPWHGVDRADGAGGAHHVAGHRLEATRPPARAACSPKRP